jgi:hypothetical protein
MKNKNTNQTYRQGDVLVERANKVPDGARQERATGERIILAHGEATGHTHSVLADAADWWKTEAGEQYLEVKSAAGLEHPEHGTILLEPGVYRVGRQMEYAPKALPRQVAD